MGGEFTSGTDLFITQLCLRSQLKHFICNSTACLMNSCPRCVFYLCVLMPFFKLADWLLCISKLICTLLCKWLTAYLSIHKSGISKHTVTVYGFWWDSHNHLRFGSRSGLSYIVISNAILDCLISTFQAVTNGRKWLAFIFLKMKCMTITSKDIEFSSYTESVGCKWRAPLSRLFPQLMWMNVCGALGHCFPV